MPTRIVREGINSSARINALSFGAEVLYRRILNIADDYGRYYGAAATLIGACWPTAPGRVRLAEVKAWLQELQAGKRPLVLIYVIDGCEYLQLSDFGQKARSKSKFPEPANKLLADCSQHESNLSADCEQVANNPQRNASTRRRRNSDAYSYSDATAAASAAGPQQQQPANPVLDEFPLTCEQTRRLFGDTDDAMLARIIQASLEADPQACDQELFIGIQSTYKQTQRSAALFESTLPQWLSNRRKHPPLR
jgi:hypothetical protein